MANLPLRSRLARLVRRWPLGPALVRYARPFLGNGDPQWKRIVMYRHLRELVGELGPERLSALEISGNHWDLPGYFKAYENVWYPAYDVCAGPLDKTFDLIIAEQVFEHLLWPYRAGRHVHQMLRPGGRFLVTTPFLIRVHEFPHDCTRWTPEGLKYFLAECGFPLASIRTFSWGNRACVKAYLRRWQMYQSWRHSLADEPEFPVQVWAMAQKA